MNTRNIEKTGLEPTWNFWKFLISEDGQVLGGWGPHTTVEDLKNTIYKSLGLAAEHVEL